MSFVHLHVHSYFSFEQGTSDPARLLRRCREFGMDAMAITDYDGLYGAVRLVKHATELGVKPIIGMEITLEDGHRLVLLAMNLHGYANLCRLTSTMHLSSRDRFPSCPLDLLRKHSSNLIALSAGQSGEMGALLLQGGKNDADVAIERYLDIFGRDHFYIELQNHFLPSERELNGKLLNLARAFGVGVVATNNVHFLDPAEYGLHEALVRASTVVHHRDRPAKPNREYYLKSPEEMRSLFRDIPEAIENTLAIAEACNFKLELDTIRAPALFSSQGEDAGEMLEGACRRALPTLYGDRMEEAGKQLCHELEVIRAKGFSEYFLMVRDIVDFARSRGIRCSCRGSASSSIVTYLLQISGVDPLANELLFERFLNPERKDIPDIDLDNFRTRVRIKGTQLDNLILCGVFERLEPNRRKLLLAVRSESVEGDIEDFSLAEKAGFETALTGLSFSGHPISFLRPELSSQGVISSRQLEQRRDGERIAVAGLKVVLHTPPTRSGRRVVFLTLEDEDGLSDITVFSDVQQRYAKTVFGRHALLVEGRLQRLYPRSFAIVAEKVTPLMLK